ncbi:MAG: myo-inosose-2 dehydratase [Alphaproteobacteria bacterium]|nr:myo-inosose-2 dehydratase [Alphaproteobacteria bacterium]
MTLAPHSVKLGIAPLSWSNDDLPSLGGDTPVETCLAESKLAGYRGVETGGKFPKQPAPLKDLLDSHGLELAGGWFSGELLKNSVKEEIVRAKQQLETFRHCHAGAMVYGETTDTVQNKPDAALSSRPRVPAGEHKKYYQRLSDFAKYCADFGVPLAFHYHMGTAIETLEETTALMENTDDALGLVVDTGHATFAGDDAVDIIKAFASRVSHVHAKDIRSVVIDALDRNNESFLDAVLRGGFTVPGDGVIDFAQIAAVLAEADYSGWIVVEAEQDPAKAHPLTYAKLGYDTIRPQLEAVGFHII